MFAVQGRPENLVPLGRVSEQGWQCNMCRLRFSARHLAVSHLAQAHRISKRSIYFKNTITKIV